MSNILFLNNLYPSSIVSQYVLTANTAKSVNVPAGCILASITANGDFYANFNGDTADVPSGDVVGDPSGVVLNPSMKWVAGISAFSIIAPAAASGGATTVTIEYYQSQFTVGFG